ncbi:MAG: methyltransferase domain-containing protein [Candidatus Vogelbacteria bacterium]|nr:methyltransferase domain-containing protein [Candidatus Vogelbacteria bacterium]
MDPKNDLYRRYKKNKDGLLSRSLPDVTKKYTLKIMNGAINCCEKWDNFLDVGASTGHYSAPLLEIFRSGTAVEVSPNPDLEKLGQEKNNLTIRHDYIENIHLSEKFDFIMLADLFEHIPLKNVNGLMEKLGNCQESGGIIYLLTPNPLFCGPAAESGIYYLRNGMDQNGHGHHKHYLKSDLVQIFSDYGYDPVFFSYETGKLRVFFRRYLFGLSIRNRNYSKYFLYRVISPIIVLPFKIVFKLIEIIVYRNEVNNRFNDLDTRALAIIFRKK